MIIQCDKCQTRFRLDESAITGAGVKVRCTRCQNIFIVEAPRQADEVDLLGIQESAAPPRPQVVPPPSAPTPPPAPPTREGGASGKSMGTVIEGPFAAQRPQKPVEEPTKKEIKAEAPKAETPAAKDDLSGWGLSAEDLEEDKKAETPAGKEGLTEEDLSGWGLSAEDLEEDKKAEAPAGKGGLTEDDLSGWGLSAEDLEEDKKAEAPADKGGLTEDDLSGWGLSAEDLEESAALKEEPKKETDGIDWNLAVGEDTTKSEAGGDTLDWDLDEKDLVVAEAEAPGKAGSAEPRAAADALAEDMDEVTLERGVRATSGRGRGRLVAVAIAVVVVLGIVGALAGGVFSPAPPPVPKVSIDKLSAVFTDNEHIGRIFAVSGELENPLAEPKNVLGVKVTILDASGKALISKTVPVARIISGDELRTLTAEEIAQYYQDLSRGLIPPKGAVPVMAVFTELPDGMAEYEVEVLF